MYSNVCLVSWKLTLQVAINLQILNMLSEGETTVQWHQRFENYDNITKRNQVLFVTDILNKAIELLCSNNEISSPAGIIAFLLLLTWLKRAASKFIIHVMYDVQPLRLAMFFYITPCNSSMLSFVLCKQVLNIFELWSR